MNSSMKMNMQAVFKYAVPGLRIVSLCVFLYLTFSITLSVASVLSFLVLVASIYLIDNQPQNPKGRLKTNSNSNSHVNFLNFNPFKGKPRIQQLSSEREKDVNETVCQWLLGYDPENCQVLESFRPIRQGTECIFAQKSKIWGAADWEPRLSLEENVFRSVPMFYKFTVVCQELGLDGFLFLLPWDQYGINVQDFGKGVRRLLKTLSDLDPKGGRCMDKSYIDRAGWVFEFNRVTFFVTTFAPCYPPTNSRFSHGAEDCFLLLQPEISFAQHDLPPDTPHTEWDRPATVRDKIRINFRSAGRSYLIRENLSYPMVYDIVKPLSDDDPLVEWWKPD